MRLLEVTYANGMKVPFVIGDDPVKVVPETVGGDDRSIIYASVTLQGIDINHHIDVTSAIVWTDRGVTSDEAAQIMGIDIATGKNVTVARPT